MAFCGHMGSFKIEVGSIVEHRPMAPIGESLSFLRLIFASPGIGEHSPLFPCHQKAHFRFDVTSSF
jgi:hypothetical protein